MDLISNLAVGVGVAISYQNLLYAFLGVLLGTLIGVLPGIGPVPTIAMLLPITYALPPVSALIMLASIYYGAQYGGSTTAILVNLPGESSSAVTCIDGYQMARQGKAGKALAVAAIGSFIAGSFATMLIAAFAPPLAEIALKFGPAEYFSLMVLGLIAAVVLASGSLVKAISMIIMGLGLGIVGTDVNSGLQRYSLGIPERSDGIGLVTIAMGLFASRRSSSTSSTRKARGVHQERLGTVAQVGGLQGSAAGNRPRHRDWIGARHSARRWRTLERIRVVHTREQDREGFVAIRQRRDSRCCGTRERQQCGRANVLHSFAHAWRSSPRSSCSAASASTASKTACSTCS